MVAWVLVAHVAFFSYLASVLSQEAVNEVDVPLKVTTPYRDSACACPVEVMNAVKDAFVKVIRGVVLTCLPADVSAKVRNFCPASSFSVSGP
jgi:hypothetical protein